MHHPLGPEALAREEFLIAHKMSVSEKVWAGAAAGAVEGAGVTGSLSGNSGARWDGGHRG